MIRHRAFELDDDVVRVDLDVVWSFLFTEAYWGRWRSRADVERLVRDAWRVVGAYDADQQLVGFARAISDDLNLAYIADVFVLPANRGQGLGEALVREMIDRTGSLEPASRLWG